MLARSVSILGVMVGVALAGCRSQPSHIDVPVEAGEPRIADVTPPPFTPAVEDQYLLAAKSGGAYVMRGVRLDGRFNYLYDPQLDKAIPDYNILRHLGTLFAMWQLYAATHDPAILDSMRGPTRYVTDHVRLTPDAQQAIIVDDGGDASIGCNGLALLALGTHAQATGSREHLPLMRKLARWIIAQQKPDGEFDPHIVEWTTQKPRDYSSLYYPGEAVFGLIRLYEIDPDTQWIDAAERAAGWLVKSQTNPHLRLDEVTHDHWLVYALTNLHKYRPDPRWITHTHRICLSMILSQHTPRGPHPEWAGGWYLPPRTTPTSTRLEALMAAYELFLRTDDLSFAGECLKTTRAGMAFVLKFQIAGIPAVPASGGIRGGYDDPLIRIDYVQHALSALIALNRAESPPTQTPTQPPAQPATP